MWSVIRGFVGAYPREVVIGLLSVVLFGAVVGYIRERDNRIIAEALAEERLAELNNTIADLNREEQKVAALDSAFKADSIELAEIKRQQEEARLAAQSDITEASERAIQAGQRLEATLDSAMLAESLETTRELIRTAQAQWEAHEEQDRRLLAAVGAERLASQGVITAQAQEIQIWQDRFWNERNLKIQYEGALNDALGVIDTQTQASDEGFLHGLRHNIVTELLVATGLFWLGTQAGAVF